MSSFTNYQKNVSHSFLVLSQIGSWSLEEAMKEALDSFRVYILFRFLQYCHKKNGLHTNLNTTFDKDDFWGGDNSNFIDKFKSILKQICPFQSYPMT